MNRRWHPLRIGNDGLGLYTRQREDQIPPTALSLARNITLSDRTVARRRGFRRVLKGSADAVWRGGAPGTSIVWRGDERRMHDPKAAAYQTRRFHYRQGVGVLPEFDISDLRLNVRAADNRWALEILVHADELYAGAEDPQGLSGGAPSRTKVNVPVVIASKSEGQLAQWKILVRPEATENLNATPPYVVLRLRDATTLATTDFYYNPAGSPGSFIERGKRYWFAWKFDGTNIVSSFWQEGDSAAVATSQAVPAPLSVNGTGASTYPIIFGGMSVCSPAAATPGTDTERNFNGSTPDFRFWTSGAASPVSHPDWTNPATAWYFEREIPDESINADGTWADSALNHCVLYIQFTGDRIDSNRRLVAPRAGKNSGGIDFTKSKVWLTGADAVWSSADDGTTAKALLFCPAALSPLADAYYRGVAPSTTAVRHLFGGGLRVPNAVSYWKKQQSTTVASQGYHYKFHDGFTVQVRFRADSLESSMVDQALFEMHALLGNLGAVNPAPKLLLTWSGGGPKLKAAYEMARTAGTPATQQVTGTTTIVAGTWYTATFTMQYIQAATDFYARVNLYLNDTLEASYDPSTIPDTVTKPYCTQDGIGGATDTTAPNRNNENFVGEVVAMSIGVSCDTITVGGESVVGGGAASFPVLTGGVSWGFQDNKCLYRANDGVFQRTEGVFRGAIGRVAIWRRELLRDDVGRWSDRAPTSAEIAAEGSALLSLWDMQEGRGNILFDKGSLANHIRFNQYPRARTRSGPIKRRSRSPITGLWEFRTRTPREGVTGREVYALAGGSVLRMAKDGSGEQYLDAIEHRIVSQLRPQPTAFQFSDYAYICPGEGPVLRVSRSRVVEAGLSPVWGDIQGFDLGWVEANRDGTFWLSDGPATIATGGPFTGGKTYSYLLTYYDAANAIESAPSRIKAFTVERATSAQTASLLRLAAFPVPRDPAVTHFRIYRTIGGGDVFRYVDQIPVESQYYDDLREDSNLLALFSATTNFGPPLNARIGIATGTRAFYAGVPSQPGTFWYSRAGFPEIVPASYQATLAQGRSSAVTGFAWEQDRVLVFFQDMTLVAYDSGGDTGVGQLAQPPIQVGVVKDGIGCVEHHTIVNIPGVGIAFAGEKGLYTTNGAAFQCVSDEIQPTYDALDKSSYASWHAVHARHLDLYLLFCRTTDTSLLKDTTAGRNNCVLAWNYVTGKLQVWTDIPAAFSTVIEDELTGANRIYFTDYLGGIFELAPSDVSINNDGIGTELTTPNLVGTVQSGGNATRVRLFASDTMPTSGDGLRGTIIQLNTGAAGALDYRRILENDGQYVVLSAALTSTPTAGVTTWSMGAIAADARFGMWDGGDPSSKKAVTHAELNLGPGGVGVFSAELRFAGESLAAASPTGFLSGANTWLVDATKDRYRIGPKISRGERFQIRLFGDVPNSYWETTDIEIGLRYGGGVRWRS